MASTSARVMTNDLDTGLYKGAHGESTMNEPGDEDGFTRVTRKRTEKSNNMDGGEKREKKASEEDRQSKKPCFERNLTLLVELDGAQNLGAMALIRGARELCGTVSACRMINQTTYELTVLSIQAKEKLLDGFKVGETRIHGREIASNELVVSFMGLPAYIPDQDILDKLSAWRVTAVSPIRRRMWPGTDVADGTRYVKVRFTDTVQSLPYSVRFNTAVGPENFRVIHDRQVRVCRSCLQAGHVLRECPDFFCRRCGAQGHYARECTEPRAQRCDTCANPVPRCSCLGEADTQSEAEGSWAMEVERAERADEGKVKGESALTQPEGGEGGSTSHTNVGTMEAGERSVKTTIPVSGHGLEIKSPVPQGKIPTQKEILAPQGGIPTSQRGLPTPQTRRQRSSSRKREKQDGSEASAEKANTFVKPDPPTTRLSGIPKNPEQHITPPPADNENDMDVTIINELKRKGRAEKIEEAGIKLRK